MDNNEMKNILNDFDNITICDTNIDNDEPNHIHHHNKHHKIHKYKKIFIKGEKGDIGLTGEKGEKGDVGEKGELDVTNMLHELEVKIKTKREPKSKNIYFLSY